MTPHVGFQKAQATLIFTIRVWNHAALTKPLHSFRVRSGGLNAHLPLGGFAEPRAAVAGGPWPIRRQGPEVGLGGASWGPGTGGMRGGGPRRGPACLPPAGPLEAVPPEPPGSGSGCASCRSGPPGSAVTVPSGAIGLQPAGRHDRGPRLGGLTHASVSSPSSGGWKSDRTVWAGLAPSEAGNESVPRPSPCLAGGCLLPAPCHQASLPARPRSPRFSLTKAGPPLSWDWGHPLPVPP